MIVVYLLLSVLFIATGSTLLLYMVAWYDIVNFRGTPDDGEWRRRIRLFSIIKGVLTESLCLFLIIITTPLRFYFDRIPKNASADARTPILFVHGWASGSHTFMIIYFFLKHNGFKNLYFMTYRPILSDAAVLSNQVAEKINDVLQKTGASKVTVISHSMGGALTRYAIKNLGMDKKVEKVIALGGPHMGSRVAAFVPFGKNTLQMTYKSKFMKNLANGGLTPGDVDYVSIYSDFDNFIIPQESSDLGSNAKNIKIPYHGHITLVYSYHVIKLIIKELRHESIKH